MKIIISEKQLKGIIKEHYDKDKLYHRETLVKRLLSKNSKGHFNIPKTIREYVNTLPYIDCYDSNGNKEICTKIPQVLYQFLFSKY